MPITLSAITATTQACLIPSNEAEAIRKPFVVLSAHHSAMTDVIVQALNKLKVNWEVGLILL
jgi:hypothetical protein